ncbi:unnamed protein product, partial [marine sediment metagenome]
SKAEAEQLMQRAERIITSVSPPDRISNRRDFYQCNWCDAKGICWGEESSGPALPIPSLSCRQCCHATPVIKNEWGDGGWWKCEKDGGEARKIDNCKCDNHLVLPGLLAFAEPTDFGVNEEGWNFIEFTSHIGRTDFVGIHDGPKWGHGNAAGCYSSAELTKLPASALTNEFLHGATELFGATVTDHGMDILQRYPEEDSRIIWKGPGDLLTEAWKTEYNENLLSLTPIARDIGADYSAVELEGGRVAIIYRKTVT